MSLTAYITHRECLLHDMGADHPECPNRLTAIHDYLTATGLMALLVPYDAPNVSAMAVARAHGDHYLPALLEKMPTEGTAWLDVDTLLCPGTASAIMRAAGAGTLAVDLLKSGKIRTAFCAVRPPGHHAERATPMGFCFINNIAVAALYARDAGFDRVAVIDFDVHHGNGTEDVLADVEGVLMVGSFQAGLYPYRGEQAVAANIVNVPLAPYSDGNALRGAVEDVWLPALDAFRPEIILVSAGFDAHRDDDLGQLAWRDEDYRWLTHHIVRVADQHAQGRIVSMLEGGYNLTALARSVATHVGVLCGAA